MSEIKEIYLKSTTVNNGGVYNETGKSHRSQNIQNHLQGMANMRSKCLTEGYSKADILNEALNIARVEETGSLFRAWRKSPRSTAEWAIVTDYAEGKTIAQLMAEDPDKKDEYLERLWTFSWKCTQRSAPMLNKLKDKMKRKDLPRPAWTPPPVMSWIPPGEHAQAQQALPRDFNPYQRGDQQGRRELFHLGLGPCHPGQCQRRRRPHLPAVLAQRRYRFRGEYLNLFCKKSDTAKQYDRNGFRL